MILLSSLFVIDGIHYIISILTMKPAFHYSGYQFNMQVITSNGVSKVVISNHPGLKEDDLVMGITGWEEYSIRPGVSLQKIKYTDLPLSYYLGILGTCGIGNLSFSNHFYFRICSRNILSKKIIMVNAYSFTTSNCIFVS